MTTRDETKVHGPILDALLGEAHSGGEDKRERRPAIGWFRAVDELLGAIERSSWEVRSFAREAQEAWDGIIGGATEIGENLKGVGQGAAETVDEVIDEGARVGRSFATAATEVADDFVVQRDRLQRLSQTGWMLGRMAVGYRLHNLRAAFMTKDAAAAALQQLHEANSRRYRQVSETHGGGFLKIGQLLSARPDVLPEVWIRQLTPLQDAAPPFGFPAVREVIESDLGKSLDELFQTFDEESMAAASIGQVHRAVTHDGRVVAVKVQRPGMESVIESDLQLLAIFVESVRSMLPPADYATILGEIAISLREELDYVAEADSMARVQAFLENESGMCAPRPIPELCGSRVLTAEFMEGRKITTVLDEFVERVEAGEAACQDRIDRILGRLLHAYVSQVLQAGIFQADPHPGNLLVTEDDELVVLDFGCSKDMDATVRGRYLELMTTFLSGDRARMGELFDELGFETRSGKHDTLHGFADALLRQFKSAADGTGQSWPEPDAMIKEAMELMDAASADPVVKLPSEFIMLARVFGTLGGLFNHYRPNIDYRAHVWPALTLAMVPVATPAAAQ